MLNLETQALISSDYAKIEHFDSFLKSDYQFLPILLSSSLEVRHNKGLKLH